MKLIIGDISKANTEVIVNASNGIGYMGGWIGKYFRLKGVAESLHFATNGVVEKEARAVVRKKRPRPGDVFITSAANLQADKIYHAVTMRWPGMLSKTSDINSCLEQILHTALIEGINSISVPLLGTGTGLIPIEKVASMYEFYFGNVVNVQVNIYFKNNRARDRFVLAIEKFN